MVFVDADMSGTGTAADSLQVDAAGCGMQNLMGSKAITARDLLEQAVPTSLRNLGLVPGLMAVCGSSPARLVEQFGAGNAFAVPGLEFVIVDFGSIAHPDQRSLRQAAGAIATIAHRVFTLVRDDPPMLARAVQVLRAAAPPKTELLVIESRKGELRKQVRAVLQLRVPEIVLAACIPWDPGRARAAMDGGRHFGNPALVRQLRLAEQAEPVLAQVRAAVTNPAGG